MSAALFVVYFYSILVGLLCLMSLMRGSLLIFYFKKNKSEQTKFISSDPNLPFVAIQLPIFNEIYVVERLIDSVCRLDYPREKMEIQILDDSTDECSEIIARKVSKKKKEGFNIEHVQRPVNIGFKAGALANGMEKCKCEYIAIFDCDFIPPTDFLLRALPYFKVDKKVGFIQSSWQHLNYDYSFLTRVQAFGLDAHFTIEQEGRYKGNLFINFNGTGGIWKKECIEDAEGWQHDTITEDLDLSYRAQLKQWKGIYIENLSSPGELPIEMGGFKSQQYRWTKGSAECAKKLIPRTMRSNISFKEKIFAFFHLINPIGFILLFLSSVFSVPLLYVKIHYVEFDLFFKMSNIFLLAFLSLLLFHWIAARTGSHKKMGFWEFVFIFPSFISLNMGLSYFNTLACINGFMGRKSPFVRTPKFNLSTGTELLKDKKYFKRKIPRGTFVEILLSIYFFAGFIYGIQYLELGLSPFHAFLSLGFGMVAVYSLKTVTFKKN